MSLSLVRASSMNIHNASPAITSTATLTIGMWLFPTHGTNLIAAWHGVAGASDFFFGLANGQSWLNVNGDTLAGAYSANTWLYLLFRSASTSNRRLSMLTPTSIVHSQNTTAMATSMTSWTLGAANGGSFGLDGYLGEYFATDTDIQADGAETQDNLLYQLAYKGPFSVPHIRKDIVEYRSFFSRTVDDKAGEVYYGKYGRQTWANNNAVTVGPHPPNAMPWDKRYIRPTGITRVTPIFLTQAVASGGTGHQNRLLMGVG